MNVYQPVESTEIVANSAERGIVNDRNFAMGLRHPPTRILIDEEIENITRDAESLEIDTSLLRFNYGRRTGFSDDEGLINIRGGYITRQNFYYSERSNVF